ncbi:MAG: AMP-binding protein [candidate division WOR-3 bacterium]|nr:AMP-binding protein [candidate division WOR-3 bacterium]
MMIRDVKTFRSLIDRLSTRGDRIAMMERRDGEFEKITFNEISNWAKAISAFLTDKNIEKPTRVAILSKNRMEWGIAYFGITYGGCIAVPIDHELKEREITHILKISEAKGIFTEERFLPVVLDIASKLDIELIITLDNSGEKHLRDVIKKGEKILKERGVKEVEIDRNDTASIIFTSGTTGVSKGVELSHWNFIFDTIQAERLLNLSEDEVFLSILPIHHTFEFTAGFLEPIFCGGRVVYARSLKSKELLEDLENSKTTLLLGVPLLFEKLYQGIRKEISKQNFLKKGMVNVGLGLGNITRRIKGSPSRNFITKLVLKEAGLDSIRILIAGGAALDPAVELGIKALGLNIVQGYGLTEASPIVTINPIDKSKVGSIGKTFPEVTVRIDNPNKEGIGEIIVKGDNVMKDYYKNSESTNETIRDGWLYTGDMGWMDEEGYVYITGRKKSVIVSRGGKNIYPEELEYLLLKSEYIEEVLVKGYFKKERAGLTAIIYPNWEKIDEYLKEEERNEFAIKETLKNEVGKVNKTLASYKRISSIELREEEFPKTTTGKIKRYLFGEKKIPVNGQS